MPKSKSNGKLMKTERVPIGELSIDPSNVRRHRPRNLEAIQASLRKWSQQKPIVVDAKGVVIAGNGTLVAATNLGWTHLDVVRSDLESVDAIAYAIADNRTSELAEWDDAALSETLAALQKDEDFDHLCAGFTDAEIDSLISDVTMPGEVVEDEVPELQEDAITKPGDVWLLGDQRVLCGDSTKAEDVATVMDGGKAGLVFTDPPYGTNHIGGTKDPRRRTYRSGGEVINDSPEMFPTVTVPGLQRALDVSIPGACWYVCAPAGPPGVGFLVWMQEVGLLRQMLVWVKHAFVFGRSDYHFRHEMLLYGWKDGSAHHASKDRTQDSVWEFDRGDKTVAHPTSKPVALVAKAIGNSSKQADTIFDPFLGSGTTLIAAEQLGRKCYGIEIEPRYVDVCVRRWQKLTGKAATRASDGAGFEG